MINKKAIDLVEKYMELNRMTLEKAKQCAIIAIYFLIENDSKKSDQSRSYWNEVITEIENL